MIIERFGSTRTDEEERIPELFVSARTDEEEGQLARRFDPYADLEDLDSGRGVGRLDNAGHGLLLVVVAM